MALVSFRQEDCTGPDLVSIEGRDWSDGKGIWTVIEVTGGLVYDTNRIRSAFAAKKLSTAYDTTLPLSLADQRVEADIDGNLRLVARLNPATLDYYLVIRAAGAVNLYRVDLGVSTFLAAGVWAGGDGRLKLEVIGSTIKVYENADERISHVDATFATGVAGVQTLFPALTFDDIEVFVDESIVTTQPPTTPAPTGPATSPPPSTVPPTTGPPTPTTPAPTTVEPTTAPELTFPPDVTTLVPTTPVPVTTFPPTTPPPTTPPPTSFPGTTEPPTLDGDRLSVSLSYVKVMDQLVARAWVKNDEEKVRDEALEVAACQLVLVDELGERFAYQGQVDALATSYVRFVIPQARLHSNHVYVVELTLTVDGGPVVGPKLFMVSVT